MTWFTDSPFEKMMTQRPNGRRNTASSVSYPPACESCPYKEQAPCFGYCIKQIKKAKLTEPEQT